MCDLENPTKNDILRCETILRFQGKCCLCGTNLTRIINICGSPRIDLSGAEIHHIDKNRENNDVTNLLLVCEFCHHHYFHRGER